MGNGYGRGGGSGKGSLAHDEGQPASSPTPPTPSRSALVSTASRLARVVIESGQRVAVSAAKRAIAEPSAPASLVTFMAFVCVPLCLGLLLIRLLSYVRRACLECKRVLVERCCCCCCAKAGSQRQGYTTVTTMDLPPAYVNDDDEDDEGGPGDDPGGLEAGTGRGGAVVAAAAPRSWHLHPQEAVAQGKVEDWSDDGISDVVSPTHSTPSYPPLKDGGAPELEEGLQSPSLSAV